MSPNKKAAELFVKFSNTANSQIEVCNKDEVWLNNINVDTIYLFPYNHEKLKQLIQLLS